jgi:hypothetical protein
MDKIEDQEPGEKLEWLYRQDFLHRFPYKYCLKLEGFIRA